MTPCQVQGRICGNTGEGNCVARGVCCAEGRQCTGENRAQVERRIACKMVLRLHTRSKHMVVISICIDSYDDYHCNPSIRMHVQYTGIQLRNIYVVRWMMRDRRGDTLGDYNVTRRETVGYDESREETGQTGRSEGRLRETERERERVVWRRERQAANQRHI